MQIENRDLYLALLRRLRGLDGSEGIEPLRLTRQRSENEMRQQYHSVGHGNFFCVHEKHYFNECRSCRRSRKDGAERREQFLQSVAAM
jgi:hypothetical protein